MEIPCDKCGSGNPLGAIFCRDCGEKLDLDGLKPEASAHSQGGKTASKLFSFETIKRLLSLCIFILFVGILIGLFLDKSAIVPEDNPKKTTRMEKVFFKRIKEKIRKPASMSFTAAEASNVLMRYFALIGGEKPEKSESEVEKPNMVMIPQSVVVEFLDGQDIKLTLHTKIKIGKIFDVYSVLTVRPTSGDDGVSWEVIDVFHGKVPLPSFARDVVFKRFIGQIPVEDSLDAMLLSLKEVIFEDDGTLTVNFKKVAKSKKK